MGLNEEQIAELKSRLEQERDRLTALLERTSKHLYHRDEPLSADFAEQAVEVENDQVVEALDDSAKAELEEIKAALGRMEHGTYGVCGKCGEEIPAGRLQAIPFARYCTGCI